jgi:lipopolysaccharide heptosyltransferase II
VLVFFTSKLGSARLAAREHDESMNIKFQRFVDRHAGVPMCAFFSLLERLRPARRTLPEPERILIILLSEMGSLVLAQPMFAELRSRYPKADLHVMVFARNREVLDLLRVVPPENVHALDDRSLGLLVRDSLKVVRRMRALRFDVVIDCELFARVSSLFSWLSSAPIRVGFHPHTQEGLYRGSFINRPVPYNPYHHLTRQFVTMAGAIGDVQTLPITKNVRAPETFVPPRVELDANEKSRKIAKLESDFPSLAGQKLILVSPSGGALPIRAWPFEHYVTLCRALLAQGYAVGIIGLPQDKTIGEALARACQDARCVDLTGYTDSIRHLLILFYRADLLIANDGGPAQFAAMTPIPAITFFGPETPVLYGSWAPRAFSFYLPLPCSPCLTAYNHRNSPCDGDNQCLKQIPPEIVLAKSLEMLAQ